jgi:hypothetical protein
VTRQDACRIGQRQDLDANRPQERVEIAPGQIGAADRPLEEHVTGDRDAVPQERDVARRVAGHVSHGELPRADGEDVAMGQFGVGWSQPRQPLEAEHRALFRQDVVPAAVGGMEVHPGARRRPDRLDAPDVVDVRVGEPDVAHLKVAMPDRGEDPFVLLAGVDHRGAPRGGIDHEPGILGEGPVRQADQVGPRGICHAAPGCPSDDSAVSSTGDSPIP